MQVQIGNICVNNDLVTARKMAKNPFDKPVVVTAESEQKMTNVSINNSIQRSMYDMHWCTPLCIGKVNGVQTAGCSVRGAPQASAGPGGRATGSQNSANDANG